MSVEELVNRTRAAIPDTFEYDKESDGYYDTPITHILRENADKLEELAAENERLRGVLMQTGIEWAVRMYDALAQKDKEIAAFREVISTTRKLVAEAALTGFNCHDGDWAERLFFNQQSLSKAIDPARNAGGNNA